MLGANVDAGEQLGSIVFVVSRSEVHRSARGYQVASTRCRVAK
jgi:hypothetical protein